MGLISVTYYFSIERINIQSATLKVSTAKQDFASLDNAVLSTIWQPGSSATYDISDSGGQTNIEPNSNVLIVTASDNNDQRNNLQLNRGQSNLSPTLYSGSYETGLYLKGDSQTITIKAARPSPNSS